MSESPNSLQGSLTLRPVARVREWARRAISPWAQRVLTGRAVLRPPNMMRAVAHIARIQARAQRRSVRQPAWVQRAPTLSPRMVDGFTQGVANRFAPALARRLSEGAAAMSTAPLDMPLITGAPAQEAQSLPDVSAMPPVESMPPQIPAGLPPLGARTSRPSAFARPASAQSATAPTASPPAISNAPRSTAPRSTAPRSTAPRPTAPRSTAPRPTAERIRRYSRVEEIDPATLALQNERRQTADASVSVSGPAPQVGPIQPADEGRTPASFQPALDAGEIEPAFANRLPVPPAPRVADNAPQEAGPRPGALSTRPGAAPTTATGDQAPSALPAGAESAGMSVLQRMRQARAMQLRRQMERAGSEPPAVSPTPTPTSSASSSASPAQAPAEPLEADQLPSARRETDSSPAQPDRSPISSARPPSPAPTVRRSPDTAIPPPAHDGPVSSETGAPERAVGAAPSSAALPGALDIESEAAPPPLPAAPSDEANIRRAPAQSSAGQALSSSRAVSDVNVEPARLDRPAQQTTPLEQPMSAAPQAGSSRQSSALPLADSPAVPSTPATQPKSPAARDLSLPASDTPAPSLADTRPVVRRAAAGGVNQAGVETAAGQSAQAVMADMAARVIARATAGARLPLSASQPAGDWPLQTPAVLRREPAQQEAVSDFAPAPARPRPAAGADTILAGQQASWYGAAPQSAPSETETGELTPAPEAPAPPPAGEI